MGEQNVGSVESTAKPIASLAKPEPALLLRAPVHGFGAAEMVEGQNAVSVRDVAAPEKMCQSRARAYIPFMSRVSRRLENPPADALETREAPAGWLESLERSEAQLARGETLPLEPVLDLMRASIARMESKRAGIVVGGA